MVGSHSGKKKTSLKLTENKIVLAYILLGQFSLLTDPKDGEAFEMSD